MRGLGKAQRATGKGAKMSQKWSQKWSQKELQKQAFSEVQNSEKRWFSLCFRSKWPPEGGPKMEPKTSQKRAQNGVIFGSKSAFWVQNALLAQKVNSWAKSAIFSKKCPLELSRTHIQVIFLATWPTGIPKSSFLLRKC